MGAAWAAYTSAMTGTRAGRWLAIACSTTLLLAAPACTASPWGSHAITHRPGDRQPSPTAPQARLSWSRVDPVAFGASRGRDPVAGFHVYSGRSPDRLRRVATIRDTSATQYVVSRLPRGTWYFTVSTFTRRGVESELPPPVSKTIR